MVTKTMDEALATFIKDVGFPIAAFIMMLLLYMDNIKRADKKQDDYREEIKELTKRFVETVETLIKNNSEALEKLHVAMEMHVKSKEMIYDEMKECRRERDNHFARIEDKI